MSDRISPEADAVTAEEKPICPSVVMQAHKFCTVRIRRYAVKEDFSVLVAPRIVKKQDILRRIFVQIIFESKQRINPLLINAVTVCAFKYNKLDFSPFSCKINLKIVMKPCTKIGPALLRKEIKIRMVIYTCTK